MIFCTTQSVENYSYGANGIAVGPWAKYRNEPLVFAALSFMSPLLYQWEIGSPVPMMERLTAPEASVDKQLRQTLTASLYRGKTFQYILLSAKDPKDVRDKLYEVLDRDDRFLPIYATYTKDQLRLIMDARVASWAKTFTPSVAVLTWATTKSNEEKIVKENAYGKYIKIHQ